MYFIIHTSRKLLKLHKHIAGLGTVSEGWAPIFIYNDSNNKKPRKIHPILSNEEIAKKLLKVWMSGLLNQRQITLKKSLIFFILASERRT